LKSFYGQKWISLIVAISLVLGSVPVSAKSKRKKASKTQPDETAVESSKSEETAAAPKDEGWQKRYQAEWHGNQPRAEEWFFHDLPRHIGGDFKETFWNGWHLLFLAGGIGASLGIHTKDNAIRDSFQRHRPLGSAVDNTINIGFHPIVLGGAGLLALGVSKFYHADKAALTSGTMLEALTLTEVLTLGLKYTTRRRRPDGTNYSFPSAHASGAFCLATVAEIYYGPKAGIPSYLLASLIGVSRLDANKHFASDVVAGAVLGTLMGWGTAKWHKKEFPNFFIAPVAGDGSPGVSLVYNFK